MAHRPPALFSSDFQDGEAVGRPVERGDAGAFRGEEAGEFPADAPGGPGNQRDAIGEGVHVGSVAAVVLLLNYHAERGYASSGPPRRPGWDGFRGRNLTSRPVRPSK